MTVKLEQRKATLEVEEIKESSEKAKESGEQTIGLTMAIMAVLLAFATMLGHRTHTEEVLIQTKANDQWAYYQAKNIRSHMYQANYEMAELIRGDASVAEDFRKKSEDQKQGAEVVHAKAEDLEREVEVATRRAGRFDTSEIFLEIAIVLCSITLLTGTRAYWRISFISSAVGIAFMVSSFLIH
jgi:uncharacterized protein DUF4337